jgi:hypothetical protein
LDLIDQRTSAHHAQSTVAIESYQTGYSLWVFLAHGLTHWNNILERTAAITHFNWTFHFGCLGGSKSKLIAAVVNLEAMLEGVFVDGGGGKGGNEQQAETLLLPLSRGITFPNLQWRVHNYNGHIRIGAGK